MLANSNISTIIAVKDINEGKRFYGETLGLEKIKENTGGVTYRSGASTLYIYESAENAGTNKATAAGWQVDDLQSEVDELKSKGITFEQYDMPGMTREGDIHMAGSEKMAWFKDPDGTILVVESLNS